MAEATLMRHWAARRRTCGDGAFSIAMMHGTALAACQTRLVNGIAVATLPSHVSTSRTSTMTASPFDLS